MTGCGKTVLPAVRRKVCREESNSQSGREQFGMMNGRRGSSGIRLRRAGLDDGCRLLLDILFSLEN